MRGGGAVCAPFPEPPPFLEESNVRQWEGLGTGVRGYPPRTLPHNNPHDALRILRCGSWGRECSEHFLSGPLCRSTRGRPCRSLRRGLNAEACPLCDIPSGCCSFMGPWTVTRSSLRMLRRVAAFCRPLRPVLLLVSFLRSQSLVVGVLGLC